MLEVRASRRWILSIPVLVASVGCGPTVPLLAVVEEGSSGGDGAQTSTTAVEVEAESSGSESTGEEPNSFIEPIDAGGSYECDLWVQDCPEGEKCTVWANDGGNAWNATRCVPVVDEPGGPGDPCTVEGNAVSGLDTCAVGALCWDVDPETNEGVCREYCQGDESNPFCEDPETQCGGPRNFPLCLPSCCPIEQDCSLGQGCYPISDTFGCAPDASGETGGYADPCEFINVCDPGLACLGPEATPGCEGYSGCCAPFCVIGSMACAELHPDLECVAWYDEGLAPPGLEHTGVCILPG